MFEPAETKEMKGLQHRDKKVLPILSYAPLSLNLWLSFQGLFPAFHGRSLASALLGKHLL